MTIGILWEFYEFTADVVFRTDMQKDRIVQNISSVELHPEKKNIPIKVNDIEKTQIYKKDGSIVITRRRNGKFCVAVPRNR